MTRRKAQHRGTIRANRPRLEGLESRQLLAVTLAQHPLPSAAQIPTSIVRGPDNNMYFTIPAVVVNSVANPVAAIGVINPATKAIAEFPAPNPTSSLGPIISGPNGGLWFADNNNITHTAAIGVFNPANHAVGETTMAVPGINISGLAAGPDNALYFTDAGNSAIGRFDPVTGSVVEFPLATTNASPGALIADGGGNLWFTTGTPPAINEFNTTTHAISSFALPVTGAVDTARAGTLGADGNIYFSETVNLTATFPVPVRSPTFVVMLISINPTTGATKSFGPISPGGITAGPDGNIWFAIGETNPTTGITATYATPLYLLLSASQAIATGPDGHLYFTETGEIGELTPIPASQGVIAGNVGLDPAGSAESGNNPIAGQVVFVDLKNDGTLDPGDPSAVTDASGVYQIPVVPGTYTVRLVASPGNTITAPAGAAVSATVAAGQNVVTSPFAIIPTSIVLPLPYFFDPFGGPNPDLQTSEVNGLYKAILNRDPSASELTTAVGLLKNGTAVSAVATALLHSAEYDADFVTSDYRVFLGVNPSSADVNAWVQIIQAQGLGVQQVASLFLNSPNFSALHPDNASFIQALYVDVFGRQAGASEVAAWDAVLTSGTTRSQAIRAILTSPFAAQREVDGLYAEFLSRPSDASGLAFWVNAVEAGTPLETVAAGFAGGSEFARRASSSVV